jgi:hypothetical protein
MGVSDLVARLPLAHRVSHHVAYLHTLTYTYVCLLSRAAKFVLTALYWLNLALRSLSILTTSYVSVSMGMRTQQNEG